MTRARILLVEDNAINRQLAFDILEHAGFEVIEAANVDEGRAQLRERRPHLVVMDIQIPGGGGERLLREIRADAHTAALPVVAVTAFAMDGDRERLLAAGFDGYLSKPIDTRTFAATIASVLESGEVKHGYE